MQQDLLLEIGLEEVPARVMPLALQKLQDNSHNIFTENRLGFEEITAYGTPRRLTLYIKNLELHQSDLVEELKGPPANISFDDKGDYTKASIGFAKSCGVSPEELVVKNLAEGEYIFAEKRVKGRTTVEILPEILPQIVAGINLPKSMRWGYGDIRFIRPIKWIAALYGKTTINFEFAGVKSGRKTHGHRFLSTGEIEISSPSQYFSKLNDNYVIVEPEQRKSMVKEQVEKLAFQAGGFAEITAELLEEITFLLEYPTALLGKFSEKYLELPKEVLITTMKEHQRYFPVYKESGELLPYFIAVRNGTSDYIDIVSAGNEKVLEARLADARFFYEEDIVSSLAEKVEKLKHVLYQENLGTVFEKVERIKTLTVYLTEILKASPEAIDNSLRCAYLAKADLVTSMVYEFPELQGVMGYYYARHHGENEEVCLGIMDHYKPRYSGDELPKGIAGTVVAIADKIDTIVGCFIAGIQPTGSQDPFGLRRQAQGICYLIKDKDLDIILSDLISKSYDKYCEQLGVSSPKEDIVAQTGEFFKRRFESIMEENGIPYDVINATLSVDWDRGYDTFKIADDLLRFKSDKEIESLLTAYNRAGNIAKKAKTDEVSEQLFADKAEIELWNEFTDIKKEGSQLLNRGEYFEYFNCISGLRMPIDNFFDNVMVMVEDEDLKSNRLALIKRVSDFMAKAADLSKIIL